MYHGIKIQPNKYINGGRKEKNKRWREGTSKDRQKTQRTERKQAGMFPELAVFTFKRTGVPHMLQFILKDLSFQKENSVSMKVMGLLARRGPH